MTDNTTADDAQLARWSRREHLGLLLSRMQRGVLLPAERDLLRAAVDTELADAETAHAALERVRAVLEAAERDAGRWRTAYPGLTWIGAIRDALADGNQLEANEPSTPENAPDDPQDARTAPAGTGRRPESANGAPDRHTAPRRFHLIRREDETGVSGTGVIVEGIEFTDGTVALRWLTGTTSTAVYASIDDVRTIHGHGGKTIVNWMDNDTAGAR